MTTSWAYVTRGHWHLAVQTNAGGALLAVLALVTAPTLLAVAIRGRVPRVVWWEAAALRVAVVVAAVTLVDWWRRGWWE